MHRFYLDQSSFVHGGAEMGSEEPVIGQKVSTSLHVHVHTCVDEHAISVHVHVHVHVHTCVDEPAVSVAETVQSCIPLSLSLSQAIHEKIESLELKQVHAKIRQVDSHSTLGNGIVIQVSGQKWVWVVNCKKSSATLYIIV